MKRKERRRWPREVLPTSQIGIVYPQFSEEEQGSASEDKPDTLLVYPLNMGKGGLLLESCQGLQIDSLIDILIQLPHDKVWMSFKGKVIWVNESSTKPNYYLLGVKFQAQTLHEQVPMHTMYQKKRMSPSDLEFLIHTQLFDAIPQEAKCPLLNWMTPKHLQAGERLISQGDEGDAFYIIQDGSCVVHVEKDGIKHSIARIRAGDVVGEMAVLTDEPRSAHVDAETNMKLWSISRAKFDVLCKEYSGLRDFLTELVTHRLSSRRLTADRTVGKYVIKEIIGRGGFSIVYKGIHASLNMPVAIKMLKHDMAMDPDFSEKFRSEARMIAQLNHENIVKVYDIEELYRTIFIMMEYIEGVSLQYILEKMPRLPLSRVLDILLQVCAGLGYAHEHGIVHRDIKPANIFIQPDDRIKIVDFGLACPPRTETGLFEGTIFYMSPEQIEGEFVDEHTDIYSLGIMAYEMITGQRPFPEDDFAKVMDWHLHEDIPDPRTLIPDLPYEVHNFIMQSTQKDPARRYKNVWQILHDLKTLAEKRGVKTQLREQRKMMSLFLFYQDHHQLTLNRLVEDFDKELRKIGAVLRAADFKDV